MMDTPPKPSTVRIEVTTRCNAKCICCLRAQADTTYDPRWVPDTDMEWDLYLRAMEFVGAGTFVDLCWLGEPLLHPLIVDMVAMAAARGGVPRISTNGMLCDAVMTKRLMDAGLQHIAFSIYAVDAGLHERLQEGIVSEVVWRNFRDAASLGLANTVVTVVMSKNMADLPIVVRRVADCGGSLVVLQQMECGVGSPLEALKPSHPNNVTEARRWLRDAYEVGGKVGVHVERNCASCLL